MKKLNERRDELARDATAFCWCAGGTCSGCEAKTFKLYVQAFDAALAELLPQVNKLVAHYAFCLNAANNLYRPDKPLPEGLAPMFYHTLTYQGDLDLINKTIEAEKVLTEWQQFIGDEK